MLTKKRGRPSGQDMDSTINLRLPADLRRKLEREAAKMMLPLSSYIRLILLERGNK